MPDIYYHGRLWDAPMTDDALPATEEILANLRPCDYCAESLTETDDILITPYLHTHLECSLRSVLGDVQHLEGRCLCSRGSGNEITYQSDKYASYRESAKAALDWLIKNNRGRFHQ
jgi:hypothetical protein